MKFACRIAVIFLLVLSVSCQNPKEGKEKNETSKEVVVDKPVQDKDILSQAKAKKKTTTESNNPPSLKSKKKDEYPTSNNIDKYRLRKYDNVTRFYYKIAKPATELCMENNVPPAAILAIAGLESGWNQGYVGRISGNILSLGTRGGDTELPALRLPNLKSTGEVLFDSLDIIKYQADQLIWKERPPSLKKDYRPSQCAGTQYNLAYFKYHPKEKARAHINNINDFVTIFISRKSRIKAYRNGRHLMDSLVKQHGKQILLEDATAIKFINEIGGKPNSFNFRETWPVKVTTIIKRAGLAELTKELHNIDKDFYDVW